MKGTKKEPFQQVFWSADQARPNLIDDVVPLDDRRSIRSMRVERDTLDSFLPRESLLE